MRGSQNLLHGTRNITTYHRLYITDIWYKWYNMPYHIISYHIISFVIYSAMANDALSPGDSIPNKFISPEMP